MHTSSINQIQNFQYQNVIFGIENAKNNIDAEYTYLTIIDAEFSLNFDKSVM